MKENKLNIEKEIANLDIKEELNFFNDNADYYTKELKENENVEENKPNSSFKIQSLTQG